MLKGYFIFAYNVIKRYIDVLYSISLCVSYKTIQVALKKFQRSRVKDIRHDIT